MTKSRNRPDDKRALPSEVSARLLTPKDVAAYLNITESQVYTLMREGDLVALKIGKRGVWRVDREELDRYIERLKTEARKRLSSKPRAQRASAGRREKSKK